MSHQPHTAPDYDDDRAYHAPHGYDAPDPDDHSGYHTTGDLLSFTDADDFAVYAPDSPERHTLVLGGLLNFTPGDLVLNRAGELSPAQVARLRHMVRQSQQALWAVALLLGAALLAVAVFAQPAVIRITMLLLVAILAAVTWWANRTMADAQARLPDRAVRAAMVRLDPMSLRLRRMGGSSGPTSFTVEGDKTLYTTSSLYPVIRAKQAYRVYYADVYGRVFTGFRIVSMEPVGEWVTDLPPEKPKRKPKRGL